MPVTRAVRVHPSNAEALRAWDGDDGAYWVAHEATFDASLEGYRRPFFGAAAIEAGEHVLDIGCGNGQTTRDAARLAAGGTALGVDLSSGMVELARRRAAEQGVDNAEFLQADAQIHPFDPGVRDVAISRTGTMFFGDPVAAFANIARALRPDGRLALLVWQSLPQNHWVRDFSAALAAGRELPSPPPDAPGPFSFADPDRGRSVLSAAGFVDITFDGAEELMYFGATADDAYRFVRGLGFTEFMLRDLSDAERARALDALRATIDDHQTETGVRYPSATWIVGARRR
ncbi:MAG TPA: methyltransferase domain-containing protein [Acidimicrobiia bacterium]